MIAIDMRTVIFSIMLIDVISLIVIFSLWLQNRKRFAGISLWLVDYFLQFLALFLIYLRGVIPDYLSLVVSNLSVLGGTLLLYIGLQTFFNQKSSQIHNYLILVVFLVLQTFFSYFQPNLEIRTITINAVLTVLCVQGAWLMLYKVNPDVRPIAQGAGLSFGLIGLASLARIIGLVALPLPGNDFFKSGAFDTAMLLTQQLFFILLTFYLVLMVNQRLTREIEKLSSTDLLTGLFNRRAFEPLAERELLLATRYHQPLALLFLDIDRFKNVNDVYGHKIGDNVLTEVAKTCRLSLRATDICGRLGGEEFVFLCPHTDIKGAFIIAERMRKEISELMFNIDSFSVKVTASIGISEMANNADTMVNMVKRADAAMYKAKKEGRNRTIINENTKRLEAT